MALSARLLKDVAREFIALASLHGEGLVDEGVRCLPERLEKGRLTLAILGQFKRGKSTLINALLGAPVMPSSVLPLTSVVTSVRYGSEPKLLIRFLDGKEHEAPAGDLALYVTEEHNPKNEKRVAWARVDWPSPFLERHVRVVDTPGVGSIYGHNTEASESFLGQLDAAVFVLGVDPILTETELQWLSKVKERAERFFFVLNKTDQLRPEEVEQVMSFTRAKLGELWGREGRIYPLSARRALESSEDDAFRSFKRDLEMFLDEEGEETLLEASRRKLENGTRGFMAMLAVERAAALKPEAELRERLVLLRQEEEALDLERAKGYWVLEQAEGKVLSAIKARLDEEWEQSRERLKGEIERSWDASATVGAARAAMVEKMERALEEIYAPLRREAESAAEEGFGKAVEFLAKEYQALLNRLLDAAGGWFQLSMPPVVLEVPPAPRSRFYVNVPRELAGLASAGGSLVNLLPARWAGGFARGKRGKQLELFYSMQRDRLLSDLAERMQEQGASVVTELQSVIVAVLLRLREMIEKGLELHARTKEEKAAAMQAIAGDEARATVLLNRLQIPDKRCSWRAERGQDLE